MTKSIVLMTAIAFTMLPSFAVAMCSGEGHEKLTMSCAEGTQWSAEAGRCVPTTS